MLLAATFSFAQQKIDYKLKGAPMPPFKIEKTSGGFFNHTMVQAGKPVMIMIFSPECDHCEHMVDSLKTLGSKIKNTQMIFVSEGRHKDAMKGFISKTGIGNIPQFQNIGTDASNLIFYVYTMKILPQITFYDNQHQLLKILDGDYSLKDVAQYLR